MQENRRVHQKSEAVWDRQTTMLPGEHAEYCRSEQAESSSAHKVSDEFVRFVAVTATPQTMTTREIEKASSEDGEFVELRQHIKDGNWNGDQHKQYIPVCDELCVIGKLILRGTRIVIPNKLRPRALSLAHEGHPELSV